MKNTINTILLLVIITIAISSCKKDTTTNNKQTNNSYQLVYTEYINDSTSKIIKINDDATGKTELLNNNNDAVNTGEIYGNTFLYTTRKHYSDSSFLYAYNLSNNTSSLITSGPFPLYSTALSPDKTRTINDQDEKLNRINLDGTNHFQFSYELPYDANGDGAIKFSKDNAKIIFQTMGSTSYNICSINYDGSGFVTLASDVITEYYSGGFSVNSNNTVIYVEGATPNQIKSISYTGQNKNTVYTADPTNEVITPMWSNDGNKIAFYMGESSGIVNICIVNKGGLGFTKITNNTNPDIIYSGFEWSPDNSKLLFVEANTSTGVVGSLKVIVYNFNDSSFKIISEHAYNLGHWVK